MRINQLIDRDRDRCKKKSFVRGPRGNSLPRGEPGFVIILVAVFLLFVVGAMAALSIDVVTFYTARSEAQLAADAAALAGARVLANSGATSDINSPMDNMLANAQALAGPVAAQVAMSNSVGGRNLLASEVTVIFNGNGSPCSAALQGPNPCVTVTVTRTDLPVFFARIWGSTQVTISASATAEAFNPSGLATDITNSLGVPIAPSCVKPMLLPNIDPSSTSGTPEIFDRYSGQIKDSLLLGMEFPSAPNNLSTRLVASCGPNGGVCGSLKPWQYYVGADASFPPPTLALPTTACSLTTNFQLSTAGCVQTPIICGAPTASQVGIQTTQDNTLDQQAADAVNCMAHTTGGQGDTILQTMLPPTPFEFTAGSDNPLVQAGTLTSGWQSMVSDSLITVPVFDSEAFASSVGSTVTVIGYLQLFVQPSGSAVGTTGVESKIINMVGCGLNANPTNTIVPIYGNGSSAVPVRLISPP